ncbi:DUF4157 domain-containing protein [Aequorivita sp. H23M31]|uniref:DUF4157 domain-containing protein n=1 Tax=Aequorivita ciconiae TaxID=2494375 RepID=A0A410G3K2_9FLAO|nr:DUF4157 domain-containing protein [Aequorivita sp. H23M31]QAA81833.1 DUF4157 domain-containing protein [Aequorivita sp. H23M31]
MYSLSHKNNPASKPFTPKSKFLVQPKLTINTPGDVYEQEADAMADRVMRMSANETMRQPEPTTGLIGKSLQRKCSKCEEEEKKKPIMRKAENGAIGIPVSSSFASSLNASKGGGSPLPSDTRNFMEHAFSVDFSQVRVHTNNQASELSKEINAKAFTTGNNIYFNDAQYNPQTVEGKHLLIHELTHVVQQNPELTSTKIQKKSSNIIQRVITGSGIKLGCSTMGRGSRTCIGSCRAGDNTIGTCYWNVYKRGCACRSNKGAEPGPSERTVPFWVYLYGGALTLALIACFASGVCEAAAIVGAAGAAAAAGIILLLKKSGITVTDGDNIA